MQKERKGSGFLNIISKMNENVSPVAVSQSAPVKEEKKKLIQAVLGVQEISIDLITPNPNQPRKAFEETALNELAASIIEHGIIQPVIVFQKSGKYIIIAGERRYRAALLAGLRKIPVIEKSVTDREKKELSLIENLQRKELNPIEEAEAMQLLILEHSLTQEDVAKSLGKSRPAVANALRLLKLPELIKEMVRSSKLSAGHARALLSLKNNEMQLKLAKEAYAKKMSVHDLELCINKMLLADAIPHTPVKRLTRELRAMESELQRIFATKVTISGNDNKGKIQISYFSKEELQKIYDVIDEIKV